jgi:hypothetical protein
LSWKQATLDLSDFGAQTIQLQFNARTDDSLATDFFIDAVAVMACEPNQAGGKIVSGRTVVITNRTAMKGHCIPD